MLGKHKESRSVNMTNMPWIFKFRVGDRVFVLMPAIRSGPAYKLCRLYRGPYLVISTYLNGVELQSVQQP